MIARVLEAAGLSTTSISLVREHTEKVKPPRALFVPFPFGAAFGAANDPALQHRVLAAALDLLGEPSGPVLRDFPDDDAAAAEEPVAPVQASAVPVAGSLPDVAMETTQIRRYHEQWLQQQGKTAVGVSGVAPLKFRGLVRFLEAYADGQPADLPERRPETPLPLFIRYCADDLKAIYYEARIVQQPGAGDADLTRWFWGETAAGQLLRRVKARMEGSADSAEKAMAFGIAR